MGIRYQKSTSQQMRLDALDVERYGAMPGFSCNGHSPTVQELWLLQESITFKEIVPIAVVCAVWGPSWATKSVTVHCDNEGTVAVVNSEYSPKLCTCFRCLFFNRAYYQITLWAAHIPGRENELADAISHNNLSIFFTQFPQAVNRTVIVPQGLLSVVLEQQPDCTSVDWCQPFKNSLRLA